MPDAYEEEYGISDPSDDPDGDSLNNGQEYYRGTNPHDSDTDDGGENDGSEVSWGRDPLNPIDDALEGPDYLEVLPWYGGIVRLRYDVRPSYKAMIFRRISPIVSTQSAGPSGPPGEVMGELPLTGAYTDTSTASGGMYTYQVFGVDQGGAASSVLSSGEVEAAEDPVSPEALVILDGGAASTEDLEVTVSLSPYEQEGEELANFEDIAKVLLSNDPSFSGATWEDVADPATFETLWQLEANLGQVAQVYARFQDDAKPPNESEGTEVAMILYTGHRVYLPLVIRGS
jgi:hypothetical protein